MRDFKSEKSCFLAVANKREPGEINHSCCPWSWAMCRLWRTKQRNCAQLAGFVKNIASPAWWLQRPVCSIMSSTHWLNLKGFPRQGWDFREDKRWWCLCLQYIREGWWESLCVIQMWNYFLTQKPLSSTRIWKYHCLCSLCSRFY